MKEAMLEERIYIEQQPIINPVDFLKTNISSRNNQYLASISDENQYALLLESTGLLDTQQERWRTFFTSYESYPEYYAPFMTTHDPLDLLPKWGFKDIFLPGRSVALLHDMYMHSLKPDVAIPSENHPKKLIRVSANTLESVMKSFCLLDENSTLLGFIETYHNEYFRREALKHNGSIEGSRTNDFANSFGVIEGNTSYYYFDSEVAPRIFQLSVSSLPTIIPGVYASVVCNARYHELQLSQLEFGNSLSLTFDNTAIHHSIHS